MARSPLRDNSSNLDKMPFSLLRRDIASGRQGEKFADQVPGLSSSSYPPVQSGIAQRCKYGSENGARLVSHCNQVRASQERLNVPERSDIFRHSHSRLFSVCLSHHEKQTFHAQLPETCHYLAWPLHQSSCEQGQDLSEFYALAQ